MAKVKKFSLGYLIGIDKLMVTIRNQFCSFLRCNLFLFLYISMDIYMENARKITALSSGIWPLKKVNALRINFKCCLRESSELMDSVVNTNVTPWTTQTANLIFKLRSQREINYRTQTQNNHFITRRGLIKISCKR